MLTNENSFGCEESTFLIHGLTANANACGEFVIIEI